MKSVAYTPGVWDLLHMGHLNIIKRAKLCGDHLIVGVCSDRVTKETKGEYPTISERFRSELLSAIRYVDEVCIYDNPDQIQQLSTLNVNVFVVGEEFGAQGVPEHEKALEYCEKNNIKLERIIRYKGISTSIIRDKVK